MYGTVEAGIFQVRTDLEHTICLVVKRDYLFVKP